MEKKIHVIVVTYPAHGHINPLLQFAKRLASKGIKATLVTTSYTVDLIKAPTVGVQPISDGFDEGGFKQASSVEAYLESFKTVGSTTLTQLISNFHASGSPVRCIVYDSLLPWALDVARHFGIYAAALMTNSASVCSMYWQIHSGHLSLPPNQQTSTVSGSVSLPGLPPLASCDLPSFLSDPTRNSAYLAAILEQFHRLTENDWVFCNSFEDLEIELVKALEGKWPLVMVGPLLPSAYLDELIDGDGDTAYGASLWEPCSRELCLRWVDKRPPASVIYVSFGSMASISAKQIEEMAWGLKASNRPFLWVIKESDNMLLPMEFQNWVVGTAGETISGLLVSWCNQPEVLAHPAIGCFVTHCGWNSSLEGLGLGVPMVCVPQWSDQPMNAKFVEEVWKVGVRAKKVGGVVTREEFGMCITQVMDGEGIKRNASTWRELAKKAVGASGTSDMNITEFVDKLVEPLQVHGARAHTYESK